MHYSFTNKNTLNSKFDIETWHTILRHCNIDVVMKLSNVVNGMQISSNVHDKFPPCLVVKMPQYISRVPETKATKPLKLVYYDLSGPITPVAKDRCSHMIHVIFPTK